MFNHNISPISRKRLQEQKRKVREATSRERALFADAISNVGDVKLKSELEGLIKIIQREGERLAHFRSMHQLDHYKKKVQEFVSKANRKTFKVKATGFMDATGDYSTQLIVEKVDEALEKLTNLVMNKESNTINILNQLDLIKGMLTDLYQ